ncbi:MAG: hypothetical protein U0P30_04630 [Vicinamibacterales bacterium]
MARAVVVIAALIPRLADAQSAIDTPLPVGVTVHALDVDRPCDLSRTIEGIARVAGIRVGVEQPPGCPPALRAKSTTDYGPAMTGRTARALLDEFVARRGEYEWREASDVVYVLPTTTWNDERHVLRQRVAAFSVTNVHPHKALHTLLDAAGLSRPHEDVRLSALPDERPGASVDQPISFQFAGGTLLDALSALAARVGGHWELSDPGGTARVTILGPRWEDGFFWAPLATRPSGGVRE